jgi:2-dehydro-3-deoxygluconokinase
MGWDDERKISFAAASAALKHSVEGDYNLVNVQEILDLVSGNTGGRVKR